MKDGDIAVIVGIVVVLCIAALTGFFYYTTYTDCTARGGVLIKNAYDMPTCVSMTTNVRN